MADIFGQRRVMSRAQLKNEIESRLLRFVPGNMNTGPNDSMLRKTGTTLEEIMYLIDQYSPPAR